ncbi:hypothetical protein C5167_047123 [Papaver somniferum]|uniref:Rrp5 OB-fold domain-containing protein n=1 Tax=Papaver somniferum TaxID=3469 RepID=A0A4Y7LIM1_PAPSO|nr:hypothetical protein C5167_047123 [Papaver somniferum]
MSRRKRDPDLLYQVSNGEDDVLISLEEEEVLWVGVKSLKSVRRLMTEYRESKKEEFANRITLKNVAPGMKLWGVEANEKDIAVSLPGGLRGLVRANEASGLIAGFGTGRKKVWLSLRLAVLHKNLTWDAIQEGMVLMVYVKSIEDRGYILNFGPYSFTGFLSRKNIIDPSTRAVGLTMNYHLVHNEAPPSHVKTGDISDGSHVVRVDRVFDLLLEIPSTPVPTPSYVSISDVADGGNSEVGEKAGALRDQFSLTQMPSQAWWGEGNLCQELWCSCAAIDWCEGPLSSYTELEVPKPGKKFKVGVDLTFRVLGFKSRLISLTHKETRVKSKLAILSSYADATDGLITHGWIRSEKSKHMGALSELGLDPGCEASSMYDAGQVVPIIRSSQVYEGWLSLRIYKLLTSEEAALKFGSVVSGIVERLTHIAVIVKVNAKAHTTSMKSVLKPGHEFDQLVGYACNSIIAPKSKRISLRASASGNLSEVMSKLLTMTQIE